MVIVAPVPVRSDLSIARTRIARLRLQRGLSQREVADQAGLSIRTYRAIERGEVFDPGVRQVANIARVLQVEIAHACEPEWISGTDFGQPRQ